MNMKEVAALAGVSIATISRVINNDHSINEQTFERVSKIIREVNYVPSSLGRNLRRVASNTILLMIPNINNSFYTEIFRGIEETAFESGYHVLICTTNNQQTLEQKYLQMLTERQVDGVINASSTLPVSRLLELSNQHPFVQMCECSDGAHISSASIDNEKAAFEAVSFLLRKGHRKIGLIGGSFYKFSAMAREAGYRRALVEENVPVDEKLLAFCKTYLFTDGMEKCAQLLSLPEKERPTAIFCFSDELAVGAIRQLYNIGLHPGEDIDVVGFDNTNLAATCFPSLTTVSQPQYLLGVTAMRLLLERVKSIKAPISNIFLPHELIMRESTNTKIM